MFAATLALVKLRSLTEPAAPMVPNKPTLCSVVLFGASIRPLMVKFSPPG